TLHDVGPPRILEVTFQLHAQGAVVPEAVDAAVDFGGLPDEAAAAAEGDDVVHVFDSSIGVGHKRPRFPPISGGGEPMMLRECGGNDNFWEEDSPQRPQRSQRQERRMKPQMNADEHRYLYVGVISV